MLSDYGVLSAKVDIFKREDDLNSPHLQIRVIDGNNQAWRVPVNVLSGDQSFLIFHRVDPLQDHPVLAGLSSLNPGFNELKADKRSVFRALDYLRSPLYDWPSGVEVPPSKPGDNNDLQDSLITELNNLKSQNGDIFVFGVKFPKQGEQFQGRPIDREFGTRQGLHDIHMNQGNPSGPFLKDNGVLQDGGLILKFSNRYVGLFLRFQTQWLPTDDQNGNRLPNASPIPAGSELPGGGGGGGPLPDVSNPDIYIERALVNPIGADPGKEAVVIGNASSSGVDLNGWSLVDRNNKAEMLAGFLPAGESRLVVLTGDAAQLGNNGGTIRLKDAAGNQVHAVSYSRSALTKEGRYVRFIN